MFNFLGSIPAGIFLGKKYSLGIFGYTQVFFTEFFSDFTELAYALQLFISKTTDTDENFVPYKVHQTKTETLYYTGKIQ